MRVSSSCLISTSVFLWVSKGILWITFPAPVELVDVRLYVGSEAGEYIVKAYLGGKLDLDLGGRSPEGELKVRLENRPEMKGSKKNCSLPCISCILSENL